MYAFKLDKDLPVIKAAYEPCCEQPTNCLRPFLQHYFLCLEAPHSLFDFDEAESLAVLVGNRKSIVFVNL